MSQAGARERRLRVRDGGLCSPEGIAYPKTRSTDAADCKLALELSGGRTFAMLTNARKSGYI